MAYSFIELDKAVVHVISDYGFHQKPLLNPLSAAAAAAATAKSLQSCPTLCDPIGGSPPGSPIPGILQARVLEWGVIAFSSLQQNWSK